MASLFAKATKGLRHIPITTKLFLQRTGTHVYPGVHIWFGAYASAALVCHHRNQMHNNSVGLQFHLDTIHAIRTRKMN